MKHDIIDEIVKNDLCIGCGVCAGICPQKALIILENEYGEFTAFKIQDCTSGCGLCLKVCPFADSEENEDTIGDRFYGAVPEIMQTAETGYYLTSYVGYSEKHRLTSASGGMATWILETLLTEKIADHIICVSSNDDPEKLFTFKVFDTPESVREVSGSAYYPVEMSEVISHILSTPGRYAITGLPCFIKAIRHAQQINKKLRERIIVTLGVTCGQLKSKNYTNYLITLTGVDQKVKKVYYRGKDPTKPASNYYFFCVGEDNKEERIFWDEGVSEAWLNRWFTPNACNYCDDIFAECADVTCMDAWLPQYSQDSRGTSLVLIRSPQIKKMIEEGCKNREIFLDPISIQEVIKSQHEVIRMKRDDLALRLHVAYQNGNYVPKKRVTKSGKADTLRKIELSNLCHMQADSRVRYLIHLQKEGRFDIAGFKNDFSPSLRRLRTVRRLSGIRRHLISIFTQVIRR